MKNKVCIPFCLLLMMADTYAASAKAQTRSTTPIRLPKVTTQTTPAPRNPTPANSPGTSSPASQNGCWLQRGDGLPTQYICPGGLAGTSTSGNTNNGAASGGQTTCPGYARAGTVVTVAEANAINAAADAARRNGACQGNSSNALSGTLTGTNSSNLNGRQSYANSLSPGSAPPSSPQAGAAADSVENPTPQATDLETFRASGSDAVTTSMDNLIDGSTPDTPSNPAEDSSSSASQVLHTAAEVAENVGEVIEDEFEASLEETGKFIDNVKNSSVGNAVENFLSTEVEPDLSGALTDIGGVFIDLEKGLLDPGTALGVKAIVDQANDPNKLLNAASRKQMCAIMPDTCPPAQANQATQAAPQPKQP